MNGTLSDTPWYAVAFGTSAGPAIGVGGLSAYSSDKLFVGTGYSHTHQKSC